MEQKISDEQYRRMTRTPVSRLVVRLGIPTTVSMLVTNIYNLADTAFVGRLGTSQSGAVGIVFGFMAIIQAFAFMFGQGAGSIAARALGKMDGKRANRFASTAFFASLLVGLLITVFGMLFMDPLIRLLGSTPTILPYAREYIFFILLAAPFMSASLVMNNLMRFEGKAALSMIGLLAGAVLNIGLDPVLMFGLKLGVTGAGLSTAVSQCVSFLILLFMFVSGRSQLRLSVREISRDLRDLGNIMATGSPSLARQGLSSVSTMMLNTYAAFYGDAAVAAMSIVSRISMFIFSVGLGMGQGFQPVCAFNYGAEKYSRVKSAFWFTVALSEVLMILFGMGAFAFAGPVVSWFRSDPAVIDIGTRALRYRCLAQPILPFTTVVAMMLQSSGKRVSAFLLALFRSGLFFIPTLAVLARLWGLSGIEWAQPVADLLSGIMIVPFLLWFLRGLPADAPDDRLPEAPLPAAEE